MTAITVLHFSRNDGPEVNTATLQSYCILSGTIEPERSIVCPSIIIVSRSPLSTQLKEQHGITQHPLTALSIVVEVAIPGRMELPEFHLRRLAVGVRHLRQPEPNLLLSSHI